MSSPRLSLDRASFSLLLSKASVRDSGAYRCRPTFPNSHDAWTPARPEIIRLAVIGIGTLSSFVDDKERRRRRGGHFEGLEGIGCFSFCRAGFPRQLR